MGIYAAFIYIFTIKKYNCMLILRMNQNKI